MFSFVWKPEITVSRTLPVLDKTVGKRVCDCSEKRPGCGLASLRPIAVSISYQHAKLWLLSQRLSFLYVGDGGQKLLQPLQSNSPHWSRAKVSSDETAVGGEKKRRRKNSDNCTHFLWKACWHGNTPSSSFTLKSSKHTAHVCCVTDTGRGAEGVGGEDRWHHPTSRQSVALNRCENLFKDWFLPREDLIFWDLLLKQPLGGERKTRSKFRRNSFTFFSINIFNFFFICIALFIQKKHLKVLDNSLSKIRIKSEIVDGSFQFYLSVSKAFTLGLVAEFAVDEQSGIFLLISLICSVHIPNDLNADFHIASVILSIHFLFSLIVEFQIAEFPFRPISIFDGCLWKQHSSGLFISYKNYTTGNYLVVRNVLLSDFASTFKVQQSKTIYFGPLLKQACSSFFYPWNC